MEIERTLVGRLAGVRRRVGIVAVTTVVLLGVSACSDDDPERAGGTTQPASDTGRNSEAGGSVGSDDSGGPDDTEVGPLTLAIDDPELGPLTFDAIAAGDPAAAAAGRLVLLLHGFPQTAESYRSFLTPLAEAGYYAVAYSQRGYSPGARPTAVDDYGVVHAVGDLTAVATSLGAPTFHVVGHDWGGAVAWLAAGLHPDLVTSLTALSTPHPDALNSAMANPDHPQQAASAYMADFRAEDSEDTFLGTDPDRYHASFTTFFGTAGGIPADTVARYADVLATPEALAAALNWYRANPLPLDVRLGPTTVPTLYVFGTDDIAFAPATADETGPLVDADYTFFALDGFGHWLPETASAEILPSLLTHLASVDGG